MLALRAALDACRSLLRIEGPEEAAEIARRRVRKLGGRCRGRALERTSRVPAGVEALVPIIAQTDPASARLLSDTLRAADAPQATRP